MKINLKYNGGDCVHLLKNYFHSQNLKVSGVSKGRVTPINCEI